MKPTTAGMFSPCLALSCILVACSSGSGTPGGGTPDAGRSAFGFSPSNIDLSNLDFSDVGDLVVSSDKVWETGNGGLLGNDNGANYHYRELSQLTSTLKLGVFTVRSITVAPGTTVHVVGPDALVIVALDRIDIEGNLDGNSQFSPSTFLGPGALQDPPDGNSPGVGAGGGGSGSDTSSGAGGGFCGRGGKGASESPGGAAQGGGMNGSPALIPLSAGSAGGSGFATGGAGGGAIELVAATAIAVPGKIHVGGEGGYNGGVYDPAGSQEASGGGSGGAILLEAPSVQVTGTLAANGGGGGQGDGTFGADATADSTAAKGGNDGMHGSLGGDGSSSSGIDGEDGNVDPGTTAGGGGGAAGRIRVNSSPGGDFVGGTISPSSICTTLGTLAP